MCPTHTDCVPLNAEPTMTACRDESGRNAGNFVSHSAEHRRVGSELRVVSSSVPTRCFPFKKAVSYDSNLMILVAFPL
jgi:hypothetical protein